MRAFGFLSFGHYGHAAAHGGLSARQMLHDALDITVGADELGVNGAYFRVHHFATQSASPMPLLAAAAARTQRIEVGTGVIDMRYENPLQLAEEAAALDLIADGRVALGVSRGSPEPADRGWETFGYTGSTDPRGADIARDKFELFLRAVRGERLAPADPKQYGPGTRLRVEPHSEGLIERIWWGAGSRDSAETVGRQGLNLMSSTLLTEATGATFGELQAEQIDRYREAFAEAGHTRRPRVSVSRSVFPVVTEQDALMFGLRSGNGTDQIGIIDGMRSTFGRTYVGEPDQLVEQLKEDAAVMSADTLMLTIPSQLGVDLNLHILEGFAQHVAPALGWKRNTEGPVVGDPATA
ncbi:alkanesulfonate monooxygenase SsuD/methylene tetrahydromethanopterin reductase-like flavin-dependent oxidoreductase (luciferase family) [Brachybacterium muris]|uniref:LLM class flavin-dependent oxidoreductase n=1 Tax=Brachybacterium muris TaxID=219301 RepID=UPI00195B5AC8|nr:LLM class flavin-dependent oxidoreductase [Brachybacterium muris]MBM7502475.1 alkanesulfonate monooxygenase SsuD/methylene tetrahydromethanopterin reductase-like flavin-dependent oxidoreductase (luciferase family) [Brachybacterium muris]MCT1429970.1 LLM class flavin-dependent oxidoreductase [Brachybacterium muris]MCT2260080.1 LLM class flavin-dependent oxidoreductase [Brachybacterium muris]MCT2294679.1 LLM class flavin-dependent oxidoreductase [Brachybacterium muris]